ncbi:SPFH domain-containing protein [Rhodohalobacter mucosus]|uniref:Paraslipin n=1 Tax=Rhodohalobacter mucosus TaxID=2079485 RepID=A0A316TS94_9BACT|nr:SPFH domain-containing protein [Rhodohalobacter mucosus]PWN07503.1 paraslipin [Rhodohalobacter mucosus]
MDILNLVSQVLLGIFVIYLTYKFLQAIRMVPNQYEHIVERLGNYHKTLGPGFHALIPFIDKVVYKQDLREETIEVEPQECFTKDNVKVEVDGVIYLSVMDSVNASYGVTNYRYASVQLAQTTTRSVIGQMDLDETFEERAKMSMEVVKVLGEVERLWGIKVHRYEIKNIETPRTVQKAMERQMTAEREKRAVIARSEGQRDSKVNDAQGRKEEIVNISEAEMQRRINEAEGEAQEILAIAEATATSIEQIGEALSNPHGKQAMKLQLQEKYLDVLSGLGKGENQVILPKDLSDFDEVVDGLSLSELDSK